MKATSWGLEENESCHSSEYNFSKNFRNKSRSKEGHAGEKRGRLSLRNLKSLRKIEHQLSLGKHKKWLKGNLTWNIKWHQIVKYVLFLCNIKCFPFWTDNARVGLRSRFFELMAGACVSGSSSYFLMVGALTFDPPPLVLDWWRRNGHSVPFLVWWRSYEPSGPFCIFKDCVFR